MGIYNTYGEKGIQLKVGELSMKHYNLGDKVEIPDGIYVGYGGVVVIKDQTFIAEFPFVKDKWGGVITPREIL